MKTSFFLLVLFLSSTYIFAQNSFSGKVIDENNLPLPAEIFIPELNQKNFADFDGHFYLTSIPSGVLEVIFSYTGYQTVLKRIKFPYSEEETTIQLLPSSIEMEAIILSVPFHKLQKENVMKVEQINLNSLEKHGALHLSEAISSIPGVNTITTGAGISKPVIRGLSSNRVLTYAQNVRIENQQFGEEHGLGINEAGVKSVEVIKGPASLLYGSDALGGVLYLVPENFAPQNTVFTEVGGKFFSNTKGKNLNFGFKNSHNKLGFLVRGAISEHSDYKTGNGLRATNSRFSDKDFNTGFQYRSSQFRTELRYNFNQSDLGISEGIKEQTTQTKMMIPYQEIDNHILSSENSFFFENSKLTARLGYLMNNRKELEEEQGPLQNMDTPSLQMKLKTFNYDLKYHFNIKDNLEAITGIQGMHQKNENFGEEILVPNALVDDLGIFITGHYHLENLDFQAGIRLDNRRLNIKKTWNAHEEEFSESGKKNFNSINAALGVKWNLNKNLTSRLHAATGFRAPNLAELASDGHHHGVSRFELGSMDLKNEQNLQLDFSLEYNKVNSEFFVNVFYNYIQDYIYLEPIDAFIDDLPVYKYQQQNAFLYGGEIGFHLHPKSFDWFHFDNSYEMVIGKKSAGGYLPFIPAHKLSNTVQIQMQDRKPFINSNVFFTLNSVFQQNKVSEFETSSKAYNLIDMGLNTTLQKSKINYNFFISVNNLLDKEYRSHLSRLKPLNISDMGRNFTLGLKLEI